MTGTKTPEQRKCEDSFRRMKELFEMKEDQRSSVDMPEWMRDLFDKKGGNDERK